jgi:hypothetical protein
VRLLVLSVIVGVGFGVLVRLANGLPGDGLWLANLGGPWAAVAFALGSRAQGRRAGAAAGAVGLVAALLGFYAYMRLVQGTPTPTTWPWFLLAATGGAGFGAAGTVWRSSSGWRQTVASSMPTAALLGEAIVRLVRDGASGPGATAIFAAELVAGAVVPLLLVRPPLERVRIYAISAALAVAAPITIAATQYAMSHLA